MSTLCIIGLFLAIAVLIVGSYKGIGALPLTLIASFVVIITNGLELWATYSTNYMAGYAGTYTSYFLIFSFSALYAKFMDESGSATAIGHKLIDWFGAKRVILVSVLIVSVLTYGGVSLFVAIFAVGPIMFMLFKEANLPRHLTAACFVMGSSTYTMTALPGTPQLTNIIPTQFLGTTMTAAPIFSIICSIGLFIPSYVYCMSQERKAHQLGESWSFPEGMDASKYEVSDRTLLPSTGKAFAPIIALLLIIIIGGQFISNSAMLTVGAMLVGTVLCYLINLDKFKGKSLISLLNNGLAGGVAAIGGLAAVVSFGAVVQTTDAYQQIVQWLLGLNLHPYVKGTLATAIISGITGSSSGGLRLTLTSLGDYFISSGCNLQVLHRLMSVSAGSLDTLPHSAGLFLVFQQLGLTHKMGYRHVFVIPAFVTVVATAACIFLGI